MLQSLLDALLSARDERGGGMERRALRDELMTLLVAGQETAAIALAWACALLAHHPAAQARCRPVLETLCMTLAAAGEFISGKPRSLDHHTKQ